MFAWSYSCSKLFCLIDLWSQLSYSYNFFCNWYQLPLWQQFVELWQFFLPPQINIPAPHNIHDSGESLQDWMLLLLLWDINTHHYSLMYLVLLTTPWYCFLLSFLVMMIVVWMACHWALNWMPIIINIIALLVHLAHPKLCTALCAMWKCFEMEWG